jgi:large conductance mechanosensitive channel
LGGAAVGSIRDDFVKFVKQGNLVQLAVAFIIGLAFATLVMALVTDLITPLIGAAGGFNFSAWTYTLNHSVFFQGLFLNALVTFVIVVLVVFFVIALPYQRYQDRQAAKQAAQAPTTRPCPECLSAIPVAATRCAFCTSTVTPVPPPAPAAAASSVTS